MTFTLTTEDNTIIKESFESISNIVDEIILNITQDGIHINAIDRSHICFVTLNLEKELFTEYTYSEPLKICIDTIEFMKILKRCKKNDTLQLTITENNLTITFIGEVTKKFNTKLIDLEYETPIPPRMELPSKTIIMSNQFKDWITDMELFNENLTIKTDNEFLTISTESEFGDSECKYYHGENINGTYKSNFSIDKLKLIMKSSKISELLELEIGNDMPLQITFPITDNSQLRFLLAPRLSEEE